MQPCPRCGAALGEGARACAACGWTSSRKTLWIVLGCVLGGILLVCCGGGAFVAYSARRVPEVAREHATPLVLRLYRLQVATHAKRTGALPTSLLEAAGENLGEEGKGATTAVRIEGRGGVPVDSWDRPVRYTPSADGTFEIRSAGPDGTFDNADDVVLDGSTAADPAVYREDLRVATRDFAVRVRDALPGWMRGLIGEEALRQLEVTGPLEEPSPGTDPAPAPPAPAAGGDGSGPDGAGGGR